MKKNDWVLAAAVLLLALFLLVFRFLRGEDGEKEVAVTVAGELYGIYPATEEQRININGTNDILIENGTVKMAYADCPDQICVEHKVISRDGESIICLPNKVVVSIQGGEDRQLDGIAQ